MTTTTATAVVVNELLCYVQNNVTMHPRGLVGVAINGFYTDDEALAAKTCLFDWAKSMNISGLPRMIKRQGDNKRKADCEDILDLFAFADKAACTMPTFVAANLQRVPTVSPGDVDVYGLAVSVTTLTAKLEELTKKVESAATAGVMETVVKRLEVCEAALVRDSAATAMDGPSDPGSSTSVSQKPSYAGKAAVPPAPKKAQAAIRVKGSASSHIVKAVPRPAPTPLLKAFVGRMVLETTEEDLRTSLTEAGLTVVHCRKLKIPEGKSFKTAAFYVSCSVDCKDLFYKEETWPEGSELVA